MVVVPVYRHQQHILSRDPQEEDTLLLQWQLVGADGKPSAPSLLVSRSSWGARRMLRGCFSTQSFAWTMRTMEGSVWDTPDHLGLG